MRIWPWRREVYRKRLGNWCALRPQALDGTQTRLHVLRLVAFITKQWKS